MTGEIAIALLLISSGFGALLSLHSIPPSARAWLAAPTGGALYLLVSLVHVLLTRKLDPNVGLGVVALFGVIGTVVAITRKTADRRLLIWGGMALAVGVITVVLARMIHLTRLTSDSLQYVAMSRNLQVSEAADQIGSFFGLERQVGLPSLHALSEFTDRQYLASIGPIFGVSCIGLFVWLGWRVTRNMSSGRIWLVFTAALVLVTSNRFIYDFFYINTHIQVATFLLIAVAGAWLALQTGQPAWAVPAGLALSVTTLLRPEAPLVVAILLVALAVTSASFKTRWAMTIPAVSVVFLWYGVLLMQYVDPEDTVVVLGNTIAVMAAALLTILGGTMQLRRLVRHSGWLMLVGLALGLVVLGVSNPELLANSAIATSRNLVSDGMWLLTWPVVLALGIVALSVQRIPEGRFWTTSIIGFGVLWWLLPLLRGGPWRVGTGDSGNRILAHFLPVVMLFLVLAAVDKWPFARESLGSSREDGATETDTLSNTAAST